MVTLNSRLSNHDTGGKFIYLGYLSWVQASQTTHPNHPSQRNILPNGSSLTCFGLSSVVTNIVNADTSPAILEYIGNHASNPYSNDTNTVPIGAKGTVLGYNTQIDFANKNAGYYGFMYMVGDLDNNGVLANECGSVICFEVEVIDGFNAANPLTLNYCQTNVGSSLNLFTLLNGANNNTLPQGGSWTATVPIPNSTLNTGSGVVSGISTPVANTYIYTYTVPLSAIGAYHSIISNTCSDLVVTTTVIISQNLSAGIASSVAVCN